MVSTDTAGSTRTKRPKTCTHFWRVTPPQGELSWGECSKCGKRKRFSNRFEGRDRSNNSDLFSGDNRAAAFRPDHRHSYHEPRVRDAYEETMPNRN